ncbi:MAG: hypothetical protein ACRDHZ_24795, partial [Ktedonobacteraceae bacterium]
IILLFFITYKRPPAIKASILIILGFILVWTPWVARNYITLGKSGDSALMINTIQLGSYPYFMYDNDPATRGIPYQFDPHIKQEQQSMRSVLKTIAYKFSTHPVEETTWYLYGKPATLWSWSVMKGGGDIFIYPVATTPYASSHLFRVTHTIMKVLHWPIIIITFLGCILIWLPMAKRLCSENKIFALRCISLLLFYVTALLMIGAPLPRYAMPFLPFAYGMAIATVYFVFSFALHDRKKLIGSGQRTEWKS